MPVIGISGFCQDGKSVVGNTYVNAVIKAGGAPVVIPQNGNEAQIEAIVASLDGLIMTGGPDFDPAIYYGEAPIPELGTVDAPRDDFDVKLVRAAVRKGIPVLGICRGHQLIGIAFGGSLWQDIPSQIPESVICHRQTPIPGSEGTHSIKILEDSFLGRIMDDEIEVVNSFHHQAIKRMPAGFKVVATAADGVIEAIERISPLEGYEDGGSMIIGVQFHPELLVTGPDKSCEALFNLLVSESSK